MSIKAQVWDQIEWLVDLGEISPTVVGHISGATSLVYSTRLFRDRRKVDTRCLTGDATYRGLINLYRYGLNLLCWIALLWQVWPIPLSAHSDLQSSTPAAGEELSIVPSEIELFFSQPLLEQSQISLAKPDFEFVSGLSFQITGDDRNVLRATLPPLTPGIYTVHWVSIGEDGDMLRGSYNFSVKEGATLPPEYRWQWGIGLGLLLCVVLAGLFFSKRIFQTK